VEQFDELELQRLHGLWRGDHDAAVPPRSVQLLEQKTRQRGGVQNLRMECNRNSV
jgi:hypothetical protein